MAPKKNTFFTLNDCICGIIKCNQSILISANLIKESWLRETWKKKFIYFISLTTIGRVKVDLQVHFSLEKDF